MNRPAATLPSPRFSVIVPCYNDGQFLLRAVSSVLAQSYPAAELILVDDGSTDGTAEIGTDLAARHPAYLTYVRQANAGVSSARNAGIDRSTGDYLVFLDADDELLPCALDAYARLASPGIGWLVGGYRLERGGRVQNRTPAFPADRNARFVGLLEKRVHPGNLSNQCFSRDTFEYLRFNPGLRFGEDLAFWCVLATLADPLLVSVQTSVAHRRDDSLRTRASLADLQGSQIASAIFEHPALGPEYARHAKIYAARHSLAVVKRAYREGHYRAAVTWYEKMVRQRPWYLLNLKLLGRYLLARLRS